MKIRLSELRKIIREEVAKMLEEDSLELEGDNLRHAMYLDPEEAEKIRRDAGLLPEEPPAHPAGTRRVMWNPDEVPEEIRAAREKVAFSRR